MKLQIPQANTNERRKHHADDLEDTKKSLDSWKKTYEVEIKRLNKHHLEKKLIYLQKTFYFIG